MMERIKSWVLTFLVALSLIQSFFLSYNMPKFDAVERSSSEYLKPNPSGPDEKVENLVYPEQLILHLGNNEHAVMYPNMTFFNIVMKRLEGRSYDGFQAKPVHTMDWKKIREEREGIELRYNTAIPVKLLKKVLPIQESASFESESISRIWIFAADETNEARVFFFTADGDNVYESTGADLTVQDVRQHVEFGRSWYRYKLVNDTFYVPIDPYEMVNVTLPYTLYTPEQMQSSLFFDPTLTKIIQETDGSKIYTDGKRGLQIHSDQRWVTYSDATAPGEGRNDPTSDVATAVSFMNQRGGWNGSYRLAEILDNRSLISDIGSTINQQNTLIFQQYWGSYPIVSTNQFQFGYLQVTMQQGMVTNFERSLVQLDSHGIDKELRQLAGGDLLINTLKEMNRIADIVELDPAYKPILKKDKIELVPVWQISYRDGTSELLRLYAEDKQDQELGTTHEQE
ncbi:YycH family regulatory protein [Paenibacillus sp. 1001270B_150601_E10]|uniref:YycH family regulatory protein n=1 Tax=Paenibacillus sp. 1001270B_150601_E10 TaxID=2787079 RepID=UPI0018A07F43|nr:two-component system activity regulator YycH [Paenibacillus sp. 1001270B_150601_E10]